MVITGVAFESKLREVALVEMGLGKGFLRRRSLAVLWIYSYLSCGEAIALSTEHSNCSLSLYSSIFK